MSSRPTRARSRDSCDSFQNQNLCLAVAELGVGPRARHGHGPLNSLRAGTTAQQTLAGPRPAGFGRVGRWGSPSCPAATSAGVGGAEGALPRPFASALQSSASSPPLFCGVHSAGAEPPTGVSGGDARSDRLFERSWPSIQKKKKIMRAAANDVVARTRARTWFRPLWTKHSLGAAIGPRDLSLIAAASRRVLAVTGSAQARNVTREKPERGTAAAGCYSRGLLSAPPAMSRRL